METYERLICDLGHCLLTKGLNNDFTESGRDLGIGVICMGGLDKKSLRRTRHAKQCDLTDIQKLCVNSSFQICL